MAGFIALLSIRDIPSDQVERYKKWLRYFYDFSAIEKTIDSNFIICY